LAQIDVNRRSAMPYLQHEYFKSVSSAVDRLVDGVCKRGVNYKILLVNSQSKSKYTYCTRVISLISIKFKSILKTTKAMQQSDRLPRSGVNP